MSYLTYLNCTVNSCANNKGEKCCRPNIYVGGKSAVSFSHASCGSYTSSDRTGAATNSVFDGVYKKPNEALNISCDATECKYNALNMCNAEKISIRNGSNGAECGSFQMK